MTLNVTEPDIHDFDKLSQEQALCSGILQQLSYGLAECQVLVQAPSHELTQWIEKVMRALGDYLGVRVHAYAVGTSAREDQCILPSSVHAIDGTPGNMIDMMWKDMFLVQDTIVLDGINMLSPINGALKQVPVY